jgi:hypothetical protein
MDYFQFIGIILRSKKPKINQLNRKNPTIREDESNKLHRIKFNIFII